MVLCAVLGFSPEGDDQEGLLSQVAHAYTHEPSRIRKTLSSAHEEPWIVLVARASKLQQTTSQRGFAVTTAHTHTGPIPWKSPQMLSARPPQTRRGFALASGVHMQYGGSTKDALIKAWFVKMPLNCQMSGVHKADGVASRLTCGVYPHTHTPRFVRISELDWKCPQDVDLLLRANGVSQTITGRRMTGGFVFAYI